MQFIDLNYFVFYRGKEYDFDSARDYGTEEEKTWQTNAVWMLSAISKQLSTNVNKYNIAQANEQSNERTYDG